MANIPESNYSSSYDYNHSSRKSPKPPGEVKSFARRVLAGLGLGLLFIVAALLLISVFFGDKITLKVLNAISEDLRTEVKMDAIDLSLFSGFPDASVDINNIHIKDVFGSNLLDAEKISFRFDLMSVFSDKIKIRKIILKGGSLSILINKKGEANYEILKKTKSKKQDTQLDIDLTNAVLEDIKLSYRHVPENQTAKLDVSKAEFAGNFSAVRFNMESKAQFLVQEVKVENEQYLRGEKVEYDAVLSADLSKNAFMLQKVQLSLGDNHFNINGMVINNPKDTDLNLELESREGNISVLFKLLPSRYADYLKNFSSEGKYLCSGKIKGKLSAQSNPSVNFDFTMRDARIVSDLLQSPIKNVSLEAHLESYPDGGGRFEARNFRGVFAGEPMSAALKVVDFRDPLVDFNFKGNIPLDAAYGLFGNDDITSGEGMVLISQISAQGALRDMQSMRGISKVNLAGAMTFVDAELVFNKLPIRIPSGTVALNDNTLQLNQIQLQADKSRATLQATMLNLLPVLFSDSVNTSNAHLDVEGNFTADYFDVVQFTNALTGKEDGKTIAAASATASDGQFALASRLMGSFEMKIQKMLYNKVESTNFVGKLGFDLNKIIFMGDANSMQGQVHVEGESFLDHMPSMKLRFVMRDIDLSTCFEQCDNFDQDVITHRNIKGKLNGRIASYIYWDANGNMLNDRLRVYGDILGHNGSLTGVKAFEDFATFIHVEDLRNIRFSTLQNYFEVSQSKLYLPAMFIQSNAVNLSLSGIHTFENKINYFAKVNAGQVLLGKLRKHNSDLDPLPAENGWFNLYYTMRGTLDKFDVVRSKKSVKAEFERSEARKIVIAEVLDKEFSGQAIHWGKIEDKLQATGAERTDEDLLEEITPNQGTRPATTRPGGTAHPGANPTKHRPKEEVEELDEIIGGGNNG